ncbi:MAG: hypothetical protein R3A11_01290 [Bdellovibrionota bacterium]
MKSLIHLALSLLIVLSAHSCGEKPGPVISISFANANGFSDPAVSDLIFQIQNLAVGGVILDQDGNGQADFFAYPSSCGGNFPAGCGYEPDRNNTFDVGELPIGFRYQMTVKLRNAAGTDLYQGQVTFINERSAQNLVVTLL